MPYRLAAIDIDDTLVGPDKQISAANRRAVAALRELGVEVIVASGRARRDMLRFHRELDLQGVIVSLQGALVSDASGARRVHAAPLPDAAAAAVVESGLREGLTVFAYGADGVFVQAESGWTRRFRDEGCVPPEVVELADLATGSVFKVVWAGPPERIAALSEAIVPDTFPGSYPVVTSPWYLEFNAIGADKAAGLAATARLYGVEREAVLAFGDGNNDVSMLGWAGMGVAMPGGRASARAAARCVGPAGDVETALARAVEMILASWPAPEGREASGCAACGCP